MHWFYVRSGIYLLIIQNVTAYGFSGFYRLPVQVRERLTSFKSSMSVEELHSADLTVKLPQLVLGAGGWNLLKLLDASSLTCCKSIAASLNVCSSGRLVTGK